MNLKNHEIWGLIFLLQGGNYVHFVNLIASNRAPLVNMNGRPKISISRKIEMWGLKKRCRCWEGEQFPLIFLLIVDVQVLKVLCKQVLKRLFICIVCKEDE